MIKRLGAMLRTAGPVVARDAAGLGGCVLIAVGAGMIHVPAGLITGGVMLIILAVVSGRAAA